MQASDPPHRQIHVVATQLLGLMEEVGESVFYMTLTTPSGASTITINVSSGHNPNEFSEYLISDEVIGVGEVVSFMTRDERK